MAKPKPYGKQTKKDIEQAVKDLTEIPEAHRQGEAAKVGSSEFLKPGSYKRGADGSLMPGKSWE